MMSDLDQLLRSSGSIGANYIEAQEAFSRKDFTYRVRICRKEAKESLFWIQLLSPYVCSTKRDRIKSLASENNELISIFTAIAKKCEAR